MSVGHLEQCRTCRAQIQLAVTVNGKTMPVDAFPDPQLGNISLYPEGGKMRAVVVPKAKLAAMRAAKVQLHTSHFATCPNANSWRKR